MLGEEVEEIQLQRSQEHLHANTCHKRRMEAHKAKKHKCSEEENYHSERESIE